jgi:hypothetical protein
MKTLKKKTDNGFEYKRVTDTEADRFISLGWLYCPKTEWKVNVRDFGKDNENSNSDKDKYKKGKKNSNAKTSKI